MHPVLGGRAGREWVRRKATRHFKPNKSLCAECRRRKEGRVAATVKEETERGREGGWMLAHAKIRESDVATVAAMKRRKKTTTDLGREVR